MNEPRVVRCWVELDMVEGEHFNISNMNLSDEDVQIAAKTSFIDTIQNLDDLDDYIMTKIVEEKS